MRRSAPSRIRPCGVLATGMPVSAPGSWSGLVVADGAGSDGEVGCALGACDRKAKGGGLTEAVPKGLFRAFLGLTRGP